MSADVKAVAILVGNIYLIKRYTGSIRLESEILEVNARGLVKDDLSGWQEAGEYLKLDPILHAKVTYKKFAWFTRRIVERV